MGDKGARSIQLEPQLYFSMIIGHRSSFVDAKTEVQQSAWISLSTYYYLLLFKVDLHITLQKPINVNYQN